jgi:predicted nucleic acid-binding Zn ribbon protein
MGNDGCSGAGDVAVLTTTLIRSFEEMKEKLAPCPACGKPCAVDAHVCSSCSCPILERAENARRRRNKLIWLGFAVVMSTVAIFFGLFIYQRTRASLDSRPFGPTPSRSAPAAPGAQRNYPPAQNDNRARRR